MRFPNFKRSAASTETLGLNTPAVSEATAASGETKANVFISYARKDIAFVDRLAMALEAQGIAPSIDRTEIYAFEEWWKRIEVLISAANTIVFVLSPAAVTSEICRKELAFAISQQKRIAPIVCRPIKDDSVPPDLAKLNFISFDEPENFDAALAQLVEALSTDIGWVRQHTAFGLNADAWERAGRLNGLLLLVRESRRAATRRRNILTGSLAAGLVIALVLAGVAFWQRGIAIQNEAIATAQRNRAETTLALATGTATTMVADLSQGLENAVGIPLSLVKTILDRATKLLDNLTSSGEANQDLRLSHAMAHYQVAKTLLTMGDTQGALAEAQKSYSIAQQEFTKDKSATKELTLSLEMIGDVKLKAGDSAGARAAFEESLAINRDLLAKDKTNAEVQRDLASSITRIGDVRLQAGDAAGALAAFEESLTIARERAKDKSNYRAQGDLFNNLRDVGLAKALGGDSAGELSSFEESLVIARELAKDKSNASAQQNLSVLLDDIGSVKDNAGDSAGALAAFEEMLTIARDLAKDKGNADAQRSLTLALERLGGLKLNAGDAAGALDYFMESLAVARERAKDKVNTDAQSLLGMSLERVGNAELKLGDRAGALAAYQEMSAIARDVAKDKSNVKAQINLAASLT